MKVAPPSLHALLASFAATSAIAINPAAVDPVDVVYFAYFTDANCSQFAGIRAVVPNDPPALFAPAREDAYGQDISCVDAMACLYMPYGPTCTALLGGKQEEVAVNFTLDDGDVLYECDPSNVAVGQPECATLNYSSCVQSSVYNCHWHVFTQDMLRDEPISHIPPTVAAGDVRDDNATASASNGPLGKYALLAYYNDDDCSTLVGIRAFVANEPWSLRGFPGNEENYTCEQSMACFLNENGTSCESMISSVRPAGDDLRVEDDGDVYLCWGTDHECGVIEKDACMSSDFYPCRYHWMSADDFARDPVSLAAPLADTAVAEVEDDTKPSDNPSTAAWSSALSVESTIVVVFVILSSLY
jgi:hypothetical protein